MNEIIESRSTCLFWNGTRRILAAEVSTFPPRVSEPTAPLLLHHTETILRQALCVIIVTLPGSIGVAGTP